MFIVLNFRKYKFFIAICLTVLTILLIIFLPKYIMKIMYPLKYKEIVFKYSQINELDPYLVTAIIKVESQFNPKAVSHRGAKGLMQITDGTAKWGSEKLNIEDFTINNLYEPDTNIKIGCWYINNLKCEFNNDLLLVIAAYNGGSGNVTKWLKDKNYSETGKTLKVIPFKETDNYVKKVIKTYNIYKKLYNKRDI